MPYPISGATGPSEDALALDHASITAIKDLLREGESANTRASYQSALRYWQAWHRLRYGEELQLPTDAAHVLQFIVDHAERHTASGLRWELPESVDRALVQAGHKGRMGALSHNTLVHRISVLSKYHQTQGWPNPCQDPHVRELLARTRKAYAKRGAMPQKKAALTKDLLSSLLETCDDSLRGKRDRALLLFAWASGGRRRSEVALADMRYLRRVAPQEFLYTLAHSKTNQTGMDAPDNHKPVLGAAGAALQDWLTASGIAEGAIFRRIRKGGHVAEPLSPAAVRTIVKERCAQAGIEGDFSAHSLRSGFVTEAGRRNVPLPETMALTGHHSVATVLGYFRAESALHNQAARMMDDD